LAKKASESPEQDALGQRAPRDAHTQRRPAGEGRHARGDTLRSTSHNKHHSLLSRRDPPSITISSRTRRQRSTSRPTHINTLPCRSVGTARTHAARQCTTTSPPPTSTRHAMTRLCIPLWYHPSTRQILSSPHAERNTRTSPLGVRCTLTRSRRSRGPCPRPASRTPPWRNRRDHPLRRPRWTTWAPARSRHRRRRPTRRCRTAF